LLNRWVLFWDTGVIIEMASVKNRIRRLRFDNDEMTQEELANRAGCTRQTIIALEQAKYVPSIELAFKIARVFNVPLEEVFQYE
jgi:putative transcriptional regulator